MKVSQSTRAVLVAIVFFFYFGLTHWTTQFITASGRSGQHTRLSRQPLMDDEQQLARLEQWMNTSDAVKRLEVLDNVLMGVDLVLAQHSLNPNILARGKFQQRQVDQFCDRHNVSAFLPSDPEDLSIVLKHLLYDDSKKLVICYVPKNGCSNLKHMLLVLSGDLPPESTRPGMDRPPESLLKQARSFANLSTSEVCKRLQSYHKVVIVRNPLTRLLSAYRNKLEPPLNYTSRHSFPESVKLQILRTYRREELEAIENHTMIKTRISPTFTEFLQYMAEFPFNTYNEHFVPILNLCSPCAVRYNFYANFKTLSYDMYATLGMLDIPSVSYPTRMGHPMHSTDEYLASYYNKVSSKVRETVVGVFQEELEFYYALYPEERESHRYMNAQTI